MNNDVIITCAITGAGDTTSRSDLVPITPRQVADAAIEAANAGAAVVHVHVRDPETGQGSRDPALFREAVDMCNLQFLGDDLSAYKRTFEPKNESAKRELAQVVGFIRFINQSEKSDFAEKLESKLELDDFLQVTAVMLLSGAFDQLTGWNPHNYYLFHDANQDRWRYLPWDLDVGFSETAFGQIHVLADWHAAWPVPTSGPPNPLLERIIADPLLLQRYRGAARMILEKYFEPERLCGIIDAKYELIKAHLEADPFPHRRVTAPSDRSYDDIVESMKEFVRNRYASAVEQLENPGPRPEAAHRPPGRQPGNRPRGLTPQLASRIQRIQRRAQEMQQNGQDILPIQKVMQRLGPILQQGKTAEAEKIINEALKLVGDEPSEPEEELPRG